MKNITNKKGELTTGQIIGIILVLLVFGILLYLLFSVGWSGQINRDTCHTSVVVRGSIPTITGVQGDIPLKCPTEKVCVTNGILGGKCEDAFGKIAVSKVKVASTKDVEKYLSQSALECWTMMGEGKLSLFNSWAADTYGYGPAYPTCVICSRVAFDKEALKGKVNLEDVDVKKYMDTHLVPNTNLTYTDTFVKEGGILPSLSSSLSQQSTELPADADPELKQAFDTFKTEAEQLKQSGATPQDIEPGKEMAIVFMQISAPDSYKVFQNLMVSIGAVVGLDLKTFGIKGVGSVGTVTKTVAKTGDALTVAQRAQKYGMNVPTTTTSTTSVFKVGIMTKIIVATTVALAAVQQTNVALQRSVTAGYCGDVSTGTEARSGCSVIRIVPYNASDIAEYCSVIESIP